MYHCVIIFLISLLLAANLLLVLVHLLLGDLDLLKSGLAEGDGRCQLRCLCCLNPRVLVRFLPIQHISP